MTEPTLTGFFDLVQGRRGHFRLESGHHSALWLDLDALFAESGSIAPFVAGLSGQLRPYEINVVCGPLLGGAFLAQLVAQALGAEFAFTQRQPSTGDGLYDARYELPQVYQTRLRGHRVAIVDDVMSAGSALRGTYAALRAHGAIPVVAGALLVLGDVGAGFFAQEHLPVAAVLRDVYDLWTPGTCPLCATRQPLEDVRSPAG